MPAETSMAICKLMGLIEKCDPEKAERACQVMEHVLGMSPAGLAAYVQIAPHFRASSDTVKAASIQGVPLAPHPDYAMTTVALAATNSLLQDSAARMGIADLAQDNNLRVLEIAQLLNLRPVGGRMGKDLIDGSGNLYELKTCSLNGQSPSFTTNHHLRHDTIARYRTGGFIFAVYSTGLVSVWVVHPSVLEGYFKRWEKKLASKDHLNNPNITINFVREVGELVYGDGLPADWASRYGKTEVDGRSPLPDVAGLSHLGPAMARSLVNSVRQFISKANVLRWKREKKLERSRKAAQKAAEKEARAAARAAKVEQRQLAEKLKAAAMVPVPLERQVLTRNLVNEPDAVVGLVEVVPGLDHRPAVHL